MLVNKMSHNYTIMFSFFWYILTRRYTNNHDNYNYNYNNYNTYNNHHYYYYYNNYYYPGMQ